MDATLINHASAVPASSAVPPVTPPLFEVPSAGSLEPKWQALHQAAVAVAAMAGATSQPMTPEQRDFPEAMRQAGGWRFTLARQGVDDLAAIMEPGLAALLAAHARGADAPAAALVLWEEFQSTRDALMALMPA